jgi:hypothetical protein
MAWPKGRPHSAEHRARTAEGVRQWHASMTPEQREAYAAKQRAAQPKGLTLDKRINKRTPFMKGHPDMSTPEGITRMTQTKRLERLLVDDAVKAAQIVASEERIQKLIDDVMNGPSSVALAAYVKLGELQLKRREAEESKRGSFRYDPKLAAMSLSELAAEAETLAATLRAMADDEERARLPVIDVTPTPVSDDEPDEVLL